MARAPTIGSLHERIRIEMLSPVRDVVGGQQETWITFKTVWAEVAPMSADETYRRLQMRASTGWKITIRFLEDVEPQMRVIPLTGFGINRTLEIRGVKEDELHRFHTLTC